MKANTIPLCLSLATAFPSATNAEVYSHTFNGSGDTNLAGTLVNGANPGNFKWLGSANTTYKADGTFGFGSIWLPMAHFFTLTTGLNMKYVVKLDVDMPFDSEDSSWVGIGFTSATSPPDGQLNMANLTSQYGAGRTWFIVRPSGHSRAFGGVATADEWLNTGGPTGTGPAAGALGDNTVLRLEVTIPSTTSGYWTADMFIGDYQLDLNGDGEGMSHSWYIRNAHNHVGISSSNAAFTGAKLNSFSLEIMPPAPEVVRSGTSNGNFFLRVIPSRGTKLQLQRTGNMEQDMWENVGDAVVANSIDPVQLYTNDAVPAVGFPKRFYRVMESAYFPPTD